MKDGEALDVASVEASIWAIVDEASKLPQGEGIGACSGDARDVWTDAREHLLTIDPQNRTSLTALEDGLFVIALDDYTVKSDVYKSSSPITQTPDLDAHIVNGSSGNRTGRNRFWDKNVTIAVENNGRSTMIGEHSPCDARIPSIVADYVLAEGVTAGESMRGKTPAEGIEKLDWVLDDKARQNVENAVATIQELAQDSDGKMLWFDEYGVDWIKKTGASVWSFRVGNLNSPG